jgi:NTE family protein
MDQHLQIANFDLVLALSGGAALGAYQGGVYEALHEAGLLPTHVAGSSIGAVNGALITGNAPGKRIDQLRRFWAMTAEPFPSGPPGVDSAWARMQGYLAALRARLTGRPGLFAPQLPNALAPGPLRRPGMNDLSPLIGSLEQLVSAQELVRDGLSLTVHATDLATGEPVRFDSRECTVRPIHVRASASLIPDFDPVEVDGRLLCDGGFSENLPLRAALGRSPERPLLCFAVDLMAAERVPRWSIDGMADRQQDLHFASQTRALIEAVTAELALAAMAASDAPPVVMAHIVYRGREAAGSQKAYDYSAQAVAARWSAGVRDGRAMLALLASVPGPQGAGLTIHRLRPDTAPITAGMLAA